MCGNFTNFLQIKVIVPQSAPSREREVQQATAAALAESAAKLAQSAATIGEEDVSSHPYSYY